MKAISAEFAKAIKSVIEEYDEIRFRADYSGRGMFGKTCFSLEGISVQYICSKFFQYLSENPNIDIAEELSKWLSTVHTDNMGMDIIIYNPYYQWHYDVQIDDNEYEDEEPVKLGNLAWENRNEE